MVFFSWPVTGAVFFVLVGATVRGERPPRFVKESPDVVIAPKTGPLTLNCSADGLPRPNIEWYKDGARLAPDSRRLQLDSGALHFTQVIHQRGNKPDVGTYYCLARNSRGVIISGNTVLKFRVLSKQFLEQPQNTTVWEGGHVRFACKVERAVPMSAVKWEKDGAVLSASPKLAMLPQGVLQISNAHVSDQGNYSCSISNGFRVRHSPVGTLTVLAGAPSKPVQLHLLAPVHNVTVVEGQDAYLECFAVGFPLPTLSWKRLGKKLGISHALAVNSNRTGAYNWKMNVVTRRDEGEYQCSASSAGTTVTSSVWLFVRAPPEFKVRPKNTTTITAYGLPVELECRADGHPTPAVTWFKDGVAVQQSKGLTILSGPGSMVLRISEVRQQDSGAYQCFAENSLARIQTTAILQDQLAGLQPGPPQNVVVRVLSASELQVQWSPPLVGSPDLVAYVVSCKDLDHEEAKLNEYVTGPTDRSVIIGGLSGFTNYSCHVLAVHTLTKGLPSKKVTITTKTDKPSEAPGNLSLNSLEPNILHITWIPPPTLHLNGHLTEYIIWYKEVHSANPTTVPVKEQSKTLRGLLPWATYVVKVAAVTSGGLGPFSEEVKGTVLGEHVPTTPSRRCILPSPPEEVVCSPRGPESLHVTWKQRLPAGVVDYEVTYKVKGSTSGVNRQVVSGQEATLTGLNPREAYSVSVTSQYGSAELCGFPSGTVQQECRTGSIPAAPQHVMITFTTSTSVKIAWDRPSGKFDKYEVLYSHNKSLPLSSWTKQEETIFVVVPRYQARLSGLQPNATYFVCVRAVSYSQGLGSLSDVFEIPMEWSDAVKASEPDVSLQAISTSSVEVSWPVQTPSHGKVMAFTLLYSHNPQLPHTQWNKKQINVDFLLDKEPRLSERLYLQRGEIYSIWVRTDFAFNIAGPWAKRRYTTGWSVPSARSSTHSPGEVEEDDEPDGNFAVKLGIIIGCIISAFFTVLLILFIIWRNPCRERRQAQSYQGRSDQLGPTWFPLKLTASSNSGQSSTYEESSFSSGTCQCRCTCGASRPSLGPHLLQPVDKRTTAVSPWPQTLPVQARTYRRGMQVQSQDSTTASTSILSAHLSSDGHTRAAASVSRLSNQSESVDV